MRSADQRSVTENWTKDASCVCCEGSRIGPPGRPHLRGGSGQDRDVQDRNESRDKKWLQKIRPVAGHDTHFHVRLKCPKGARLCETQKPTVAELSNGGDGCDDTLMWWVTDYLNPPKNPGRSPRTRGCP